MGLFFNRGNSIKAAGEGVKIAAEGIGGLATSIRTAITGDLPPETKEKMAEIALEAEKIKAGLLEGQQEIEKEAINKGGALSGFIAGWRPMIGWIVAASLFFYYVPQYVGGTIFWILLMIESGKFIDYPLTAEGLLQLVLALLGMATLRTVEKASGSVDNH